MHEGVEAVLGRNGGCIDAQFLVVERSPDHLFSPITQDVGAQDWRRLSSIIGSATLRDKQSGFGSIRPMPLRNGVAIKQFTEDIPIPEHPEIARARCGLGNFFSLGTEQAGYSGALHPAFVTFVAWVYIQGQPSSGTFAMRQL